MTKRLITDDPPLPGFEGRTAVCECVDPGCPACGGFCAEQPTTILARIDMDGEVDFCDGCAADAMGSGVFRVEREFPR